MGKMKAPTPGAFGAQPNRPPLMVRNLVPPPEVQHHIKQKDKKRMHPNRFIRFFQKFFGDGF